ncbi:c-type cytochrome [Hymenobacter terrenus]|uniref:c-type cytochrome n=1 Tax=Hymenobacter terrenus TaxID=1629124 RepID=UPI000697E0E7|nr:c-type cytochrome [Hymenobacter terrenus]
MKINVLLLGLGLALVGCETGYKRDGPDELASSQKAASTELSRDSTTGTTLPAAAHHPQADTSVAKLGTAHTGGVVSGGAALLAASDCASCHKEREPLVGPAYVAIAQKYSATDANVNLLANKIIRGGQGNWGQVPMTPHPDVSLADARAMSAYVLSLK